MDALIQRAKDQRVINSLDYKRLSGHLNTDIVSVIDSINGVAVASLFSNDESVLDRAELNGGMNGADYGRLSNEDKMNVRIRGIKLDDTLQTVGTPLPPMITRAEFEHLTPAQREEAIKTKQLVNDLPTPDLIRNDLHELTLRIAQQTKEELDSVGGILNTGDGDGTD